jgi:hypothetical protein
MLDEMNAEFEPEVEDEEFEEEDTVEEDQDDSFKYALVWSLAKQLKPQFREIKNRHNLPT